MARFLKKISLLTLIVLLVSCACGKHKCCHSKKKHNAECNVSDAKKKSVALFVSAPSGCGKDTAINALVEKNKDLKKVVSVATRPMRPGEKDGFDYHFVTEEEFDKLDKEGKLIQKASVYGTRRGILKDEVDEAVKSGQNVVFNVDYNGYKDVSSYLDDQAEIASVFILPPSKEVLKKRLSSRGTETDDVINFRMNLADEAMSGFENYTYKIIGESKEETLDEIDSIYKAEKIKANDALKTKHGRDFIAKK